MGQMDGAQEPMLDGQQQPYQPNPHQPMQQYDQQQPMYPTVQGQPVQGQPVQGQPVQGQPGQYQPMPPQQQTVMVQQTTTTVVQPALPAITPWNADLFSCGEGAGNCLFVYFCTPCAIADARNSFDQSNYVLNCCCVSPPLLQNIVREAYNIDGGCCTDMLIGAMCGPCTVIRVQQEVKKRGPISRPQGERPWSTSLCGCDELCVSWFCPHCALAGARTDYDRSNCCFNCMCVPGAIIRNIVREGHGIEGTWFGDICYMACLPWCSIAQIRREVKVCKANQPKTVITHSTVPQQAMH